jgi:uncharacterized protein YecA (UPF0149 family)
MILWSKLQSNSDAAQATKNWTEANPQGLQLQHHDDVLVKL